MYQMPETEKQLTEDIEPEAIAHSRPLSISDGTASPNSSFMGNSDDEKWLMLPSTKPLDDSAPAGIENSKCPTRKSAAARGEHQNLQNETGVPKFMCVWTTVLCFCMVAMSLSSSTSAKYEHTYFIEATVTDIHMGSQSLKLPLLAGLAISQDLRKCMRTASQGSSDGS